MTKCMLLGKGKGMSQFSIRIDSAIKATQASGSMNHPETLVHVAQFQSNQNFLHMVINNVCS